MRTSDLVLVGGIGAPVIASFCMRRHSHYEWRRQAVVSLGRFGFILFTPSRCGRAMYLECPLQELPYGSHGVHVHDAGDLRLGCHSGCSHYNPYDSEHGDREGLMRHRGDCGNIFVSSDGTCRDRFRVEVRVDEIVGRMLVIHADKDDLGRGSDSSSHTTGNSGERIACGVIGWAKKA